MVDNCDHFGYTLMAVAHEFVMLLIVSYMKLISVGTSAGYWWNISLIEWSIIGDVDKNGGHGILLGKVTGGGRRN